MQGLKFAWIGDGNNMANTWIEAAAIFGFDLTLACPSGYEPDAKVLEWAQARATSADRPDPRPEGGGQRRRRRQYRRLGEHGAGSRSRRRGIKAFAGFQVNEALLDEAQGNCMVLHCLPAHRGEEISDDVIEGPHSAVWDEAENRLHVQKAIMATLMG